MHDVKKLIVSYIFVTILGVLLHFAYEWSGENYFVGLFSAVNESTWEHLKLIFFPMLLLTIWDLMHTSKDDSDFLPARIIGILASMAFTVITFYTYIGVIGQNIDFINIAIYFLAVAFGFYIEKRIYGKTGSLTNTISFYILLIFTILFFVLTYSAPDIGLFSVPKNTQP